MSIENKETSSQLPFSRETEESIQHAKEVAKQLNKTHVQEEHLFVGLLAEGQIYYLFQHLPISRTQMIQMSLAQMTSNDTPVSGEIKLSENVKKILKNAQGIAVKARSSEVFPSAILQARVDDQNGFTSNMFNKACIKPRMALRGGYED